MPSADLRAVSPRPSVFARRAFARRPDLRSFALRPRKDILMTLLAKARQNRLSAIHARLDRLTATVARRAG